MTISKYEMEKIVEVANQHNVKVKEGWKNFSENLDVSNALVLEIEDVKSLQAIVAQIHDINQQKNSDERILLRAAAGGRNQEYSESYSFTPGAEGDVIIHLVGKEFREIKETENKNVMSIGASMQIGEIDTELYEKYNLSLPTSSLIPYVTAAGLSANAGHGTGKDQPGFCGLIKAMTVCLPNGRIVRIDEKHKDFETIRASHLGLFGIVLNLELECASAKKMICYMDVSNIPDFISKVKSGLFHKFPYVSVMYVPTYQSNELMSTKYNNVIIYCWTPVDKEIPDQNSCPKLAHFGQEIEIQLEKGLNITDLLRDCPHLIPYFTRYLVSKAAIGSKDITAIGPWYNMHYQTAFPRDIDDADYLFEVSEDCKEVTVALEKIIHSLTAFAKNNKYPITDAVYLRLISGTNGGLSTSAHTKGNYVCGLDMVSSNGISGYTQFKNEMAKYFLEGELKAKPHWGKYVPLDIDYRKMYGKSFDIFVNALEEWYKQHNIKLDHSMLLNRFHCDVLQLPYHPTLIPHDHQSKDCLVMQASTKAIARDFSNLLKDGSIESEKLKQRLQVIGNERISENHSALFESSSTTKKSAYNLKSSDEYDVIIKEKPRKRSKCCVLI